MNLPPLRPPLLAVALVFGVVSLHPGVAVGGSFDEDIEGTWSATTSRSAARRAIDRQIDEVVEEMFFVKRPFARNKLRDGTEPCGEITVETGEENLTIQCDDRPPAVAAPDGTETDYRDDEGSTYELSQRLESDRIVQVFEASEGTRTNVYRLEGSDRLILSARLESDRLPEPVTYTRSFERK